jgi:tRNA dimethylallyltransferase
MTRVENEGLESLATELLKLDPETHRRVDLNNTQRVVRALEVCLNTNKPYSSFINHEPKERPFQITMIGLTDEREKIYERINTRVDTMIQSGLVDEAQKLLPFKELNALKTVGYSELFDYFEGKLQLEEAVENIKQNTRKFAKRQMTWFRRYKDITWFEANKCSTLVEWADQKFKTS